MMRERDRITSSSSEDLTMSISIVAYALETVMEEEWINVMVVLDRIKLLTGESHGGTRNWCKYIPPPPNPLIKK